MKRIKYLLLCITVAIMGVSAFRLSGMEPQDSRKLSINLEASGTKRPPQTIAHHIIGSGQRAKPARDILEKHKIDIDSHVNGVFLPNGTKSKAPGHLHLGRHTNEYIDRVNADIIRADRMGGKTAVLKQLEMIRTQLLNKTYTPLQKIE